MAGRETDRGREAFVRQAARLYDEMMSRAGSASQDTFDDIEEQAEERGRKLILRRLRARLAAEEKAQAETVLCPGCSARMRRPGEAAERNLDTASGTVRYERRHAICDRCGASFSPSGLPPEDSPSGRIEPPASQGV
jgi:hypothetical protein